MILCAVILVLLFAAVMLDKKTDIFDRLKPKIKKRIFLIILVSDVIAFAVFFANLLTDGSSGELKRNTYGGGSKVEKYEATVEGELQDEPLDIDVHERTYTDDEIKEIFSKIMKKLDRVVPGENKSLDHVEKRLVLPDTDDEYPVTIRWETDNTDLLDTEGNINEEECVKEGTLVEIRGTLSYEENEAVYVTNARVYPPTKTGKEKWADAVKKSVKEAEEDTRSDDGFSLPAKVLGKDVKWTKRESGAGYPVLLIGAALCVFLVYKSVQDEKDARRKRIEQMERDYPDVISKFTLLLSTGVTVRGAFTRIADGSEKGPDGTPVRAIYAEMDATVTEMKSGVCEAEAYERFGKRCGSAMIMKFGALLSQNLKKGGKGLSEILKTEAAQAFEDRKSAAKMAGEAAGTKLLIPMLGMLAVVMAMIIIPAFLSMSI